MIASHEHDPGEVALANPAVSFNGRMLVHPNGSVSANLRVSVHGCMVLHSLDRADLRPQKVLYHYVVEMTDC